MKRIDAAIEFLNEKAPDEVQEEHHVDKKMRHE